MIKVKIVKEAKESEAMKKLRRKRNKFKDEGQKEYPSNQYGYETPSQRFKNIFGAGAADLMKYGKGILEEDALLSVLDELEEEKREACVAGNQNHSKSGKFSSGKSDGSWSIAADERYKSKERRTGCDRGQMKRSGKSKKWTKVPCGRRGRKSIDGKPPTYYRCSDGKRVVPENSVIEIPEKEGRVDLYAVAKKLGAKKKKIERLEKMINVLKKKKSCSQLTAGQLAYWIDAVNRAGKGKLTPEPQT